MTGLPARCKLSIKPRWPRQGCIKLSILSPRGASGERTEERGNQYKRTSSPQPSPPSDGGEGEIQEPDAALPQRPRETKSHSRRGNPRARRRLAHRFTLARSDSQLRARESPPVARHDEDRAHDRRPHVTQTLALVEPRALPQRAWRGDGKPGSPNGPGWIEGHLHEWLASRGGQQSFRQHVSRSESLSFQQRAAGGSAHQ